KKLGFVRACPATPYYGQAVIDTTLQQLQNLPKLSYYINNHKRNERPPHTNPRSPEATMSANKKVILTDSAPKPLPGIYSQAIVANGTVYCSGQVAMNPETGKLVEGSVADRTHQCIKNLSAVLKEAGTSIENAVKVNVFIDDMKHFAEMNEVYKQYWGEHKPCRTCVAAKQLPLGTDVEIECIAVLPSA
ncbi:hypothetical protein HII31_09851, partial [Pseudocercospora fuligena]